MLRGRWRGGSVRGSPWHAYRVEPLSTERGPEAHLDSVKLTMPRKAFRVFRTDRISSAEICDRYLARRADLIRDFYVQLSDEHREARSPDRN